MSAEDDSAGDSDASATGADGSEQDGGSSSGSDSSGDADADGSGTDTATGTSGDGDGDSNGDGDGDSSGDGDGDGSGDGDGDSSGDGDGDAEQQCVETGGVWDPSACDHWVCGLPNECEAEIPGCNCGAGRNFDLELGCIDDAECPDPLSEGQVCDPTAPQCDQGLACCYPCGVPDCEYICELAVDGECPDPPG